MKRLKVKRLLLEVAVPQRLILLYSSERQRYYRYVHL
jgi:hypothetical protein